jgi:hypothetical protein
MMRYLFIPVGFFLFLVTVMADNITREVNPGTGLPRWIIDGDNVRIELVPVTREYTQAVFSSRGLPRNVVDDIANYCAFGTIIRNRSSVLLSNRLADWRYVTRDGVRHPPKTKSDWLSEWQEQGIAFRWLLIAENQVYSPEDWGQGFTTVRLPPKAEFDLEYSWELDGAIHTGTIEDMRCAPRAISNE